MTPSRTRRLYDLPKTTSIPGISPLLAADVPSACALLNTYLDQFDIHIVYTEEEFAHYFIMRPMVVESFVVRDTTSGDVTDFCSWYHLPSSVMNNPKHSKMFAAYSYYNVATTVPLEVLMKDCLILAKQVRVMVDYARFVSSSAQVYPHLTPPLLSLSLRDDFSERSRCLQRAGHHAQQPVPREAQVRHR